MKKALGKIRGRWIWVSVYTIAGALALVHLAFLWFDALPKGVFYAGFGLSSLIGASLAARQSRGGNATEAIIAAVLVGLVQLAILVIKAPVDGLILSELRAPMSTAFVCFVGALAGGRLGSSWHARSADRDPPAWHLTLMAVLLLIGSLATHGVGIGFLAQFFHRALSGPAMLIVIVGAPLMAGMSLQLVAKRDVTGAFAFAVLIIGVGALTLLGIEEGFDIGSSVGLIFGGMGASAMASMGALIARRWKPTFDDAVPPVPTAVVH